MEREHLCDHRILRLNDYGKSTTNLNILITYLNINIFINDMKKINDGFTVVFLECLTVFYSEQFLLKV